MPSKGQKGLTYESGCEIIDHIELDTMWEKADTGHFELDTMWEKADTSHIELETLWEKAGTGKFGFFLNNNET